MRISAEGGETFWRARILSVEGGLLRVRSVADWRDAEEGYREAMVIPRNQQAKSLEVLMGPRRMAAEYVRTHGRKVDEIMSRDLVWATADTRLDSLVGIVSRADCVARSRARSTKEPLRPAADGGEHVLAELAKPVRAPRVGLTIAVRDEVADRNGVIFDEKEHEALRAAAENAPGIKAVDDHLVWVEPVSGTVIDAPQQKRTATKPVSTSVCGEAELGFILRCLRGGHQALRSISTRRRRPARRPST